MQRHSFGPLDFIKRNPTDQLYTMEYSMEHSMEYSTVLTHL
jgi:hypothetical protein